MALVARARRLSRAADVVAKEVKANEEPRLPPLRGNLLWLSIRQQLQEEYERRAAAEREWRERTGWGSLAAGSPEEAMDSAGERCDEELAMLEAQHADRHMPV